MNKLKLIKIRHSLRSSYWFVPILMMVLAMWLAIALPRLDQAGKSGPLAKLGWIHIFHGGADSALTLLSTVAGSMMTVAVTAFSVTLVALTLASQQFGPRVLRNFMVDRSYQFVLGTFIATFIYCLIVLRTIRSAQDHPFVPEISLTVAIVLTIISTGVLIYFIHHASTSIHAWNIIGKIGTELNDSIDELFPLKLLGLPKHKPRWVVEIPSGFDQEASPIPAAGSGYIQAIDDDLLMRIAKSNDLLLRAKKRAGKFLVQGTELVLVWPGEQVNQKLIRQINDAFLLGKQRTAHQDVEFSIKHLVEIAIRSLSPAINDPFTAIGCIDLLCAALCRLAERDLPSPYVYDDDGNLRLITNPVTFAGLADDAFHQIRQYGRSDAAVTIRLLDAIEVIAKHTHNEMSRMALLRHATMIERGSQEGLAEELDRKEVQARYQSVLRALNQLAHVGN